jgi:hypothetical protein
MSNGDQQNSTNGLMRWLADQFGEIQGAIGELRAQQMGNRQTVIEVYHQLTHRMDRIEDRIGQRRLSWLRHIPYVKLTLLAAGVLLVATGHLTVAELKNYIVHKLTD